MNYAERFSPNRTTRLASSLLCFASVPSSLAELGLQRREDETGNGRVQKKPDCNDYFLSVQPYRQEKTPPTIMRVQYIVGGEDIVRFNYGAEACAKHSRCSHRYLYLFAFTDCDSLFTFGRPSLNRRDSLLAPISRLQRLSTFITCC